MSEGEKNDRILGQAIQKAGNVVLPVVFEFDRESNIPDSEFLLNSAFRSVANAERFNQFSPITAKRPLVPVKVEHMGRHRINLLIFLAIFTFPLFNQASYHLDIAVNIGIFSILSMGLNLLLGNTGQISLGHAAFFGIGAYMNALLTRDVGLSFWIALPISSLFTGIIGYGIGLTSLRLKGHYLAMATLAFGIITSTVITEWTELTGGTGGFRNIPYPAIGSFRFDSGVKYFYLVWTFVILIFLFTENFLSTRVGRALKAIHKNEDAANVLGINPTKYKLKIFGLSAIYAGLAGALFANHSNFISSESFSIMVSVAILCMIVIGGLGKTWGSIMGSCFLTLFPEFIRYIADSPFFSESVRRMLTNYSYHLFIYGILMLLIIVFLPGGLISLFQRRGGMVQNAHS